MRYSLICDWCGKSIERYQLNKHNFCSRQCLADFSNKSKNPTGYATLKSFVNISAHLTRLNKELNPERMTPETRKKLRDFHMNSGEGKTYTKRYGRHQHRIVAEQILGRSLLPGEVVHHIDGNKRNNDPRNIRIFDSQSAHVKFHCEFNWFLSELKKLEEVMPYEVQST